MLLLRNRLVENLAGLAVLVFALADYRLPHLQGMARLGGLAYGIYLSHLLLIKTPASRGRQTAPGRDAAARRGRVRAAAASSTLLSWLLARSRWTNWLVG